MRKSEIALAAVPLGLYLLNGVLSLVRPGPYLPSAWLYFLTGLPIVGYVGYHLLGGQTFYTWENVALGVLALSVITVMLPWGPAMAGMPLRSVPFEYYLLTSTPIVGFLAVYVATRVARRRGVASNGR